MGQKEAQNTHFFHKVASLTAKALIAWMALCNFFRAHSIETENAAAISPTPRPSMKRITSIRWICSGREARAAASMVRARSFRSSRSYSAKDRGQDLAISTPLQR
jgi:hypothetical protein